MKEIHALTQKCCTPEQWEKMVAENPDLVNKQKEDEANAKCIGHSHQTFLRLKSLFNYLNDLVIEEIKKKYLFSIFFCFRNKI